METAVQLSIFATTFGSTSIRAKRVSPEGGGLEAVVTSLAVGPDDGSEQPESDRDSAASRPTPRRRDANRAMATGNATPTGSWLEALTRRVVGDHAEHS
jgi:hypothetical protein